jgi:hypothetical protein
MSLETEINDCETIKSLSECFSRHRARFTFISIRDIWNKLDILCNEDADRSTDSKEIHWKYTKFITDLAESTGLNAPGSMIISFSHIVSCMARLGTYDELFFNKRPQLLHETFYPAHGATLFRKSIPSKWCTLLFSYLELGYIDMDFVKAIGKEVTKLKIEKHLEAISIYLDAITLFLSMPKDVTFRSKTVSSEDMEQANDTMRFLLYRIYAFWNSKLLSLDHPKWVWAKILHCCEFCLTLFPEDARLTCTKELIPLLRKKLPIEIQKNFKLKAGAAASASEQQLEKQLPRAYLMQYDYILNSKILDKFTVDILLTDHASMVRKRPSIAIEYNGPKHYAFDINKSYKISHLKTTTIRKLRYLLTYELNDKPIGVVMINGTQFPITTLSTKTFQDHLEEKLDNAPSSEMPLGSVEKHIAQLSESGPVNFRQAPQAYGEPQVPESDPGKRRKF